MYPARICFFDVGLDELPKRDQRSMRKVARVILKAGRFSVFDATSTEDLAETMDKLSASGWLEFDNEKHGYPWTGVKLTEAGKKALKL